MSTVLVKFWSVFSTHFELGSAGFKHVKLRVLDGVLRHLEKMLHELALFLAQPLSKHTHKCVLCIQFTKLLGQKLTVSMLWGTKAELRNLSIEMPDSGYTLTCVLHLWSAQKLHFFAQYRAIILVLENTFQIVIRGRESAIRPYMPVLENIFKFCTESFLSWLQQELGGS